jgi:sulfite reductase (NADPH) flavoprotein alpha-component
VGNIEPSSDPRDVVRGVVHLCEDFHLARLDQAEAFGHGYDRVTVPVETERGVVQAVAYVGIASFLNELCLPTQRYLNILVRGAAAAGLDPAYVEQLRRHPIHQSNPYPAFAPPPGEHPTFTAASLAEHPIYTALAGAVFDMSGARWQHEFLKGYFGGKDMTLFHLQRLDSSDGRETLDDVKNDRLSSEQRRYLNDYLRAYGAEYAYVGRFVHG